MGRRAEKKTPKTLRGIRSDWNTAARTIKRNELDIVASICGTTRDVTEELQRRVTSTNNEHDDGAAAERAASESITVDSDTTSTTTV